MRVCLHQTEGKGSQANRDFTEDGKFEASQENVKKSTNRVNVWREGIWDGKKGL